MNKQCDLHSMLLASWKDAGTPKRIMIALSGGGDSVALFDLLWYMAQKCDVKLAAVHVNHHLRSSAEQDAAFCRQLCKERGVTLYEMDVYPKSPSENDARTARYDAFSSAYTAWNGDVLALAHHASDQAETVLMHLLRGTGSRGMAGMKKDSCLRLSSGVTLRLWRPLLGIQPQDLRRYAQANNLNWCEDETNQTTVYSRNYLRNEIIPRLEARFTGAQDAICRTAETIALENQWMEEQVTAFLKAHGAVRGPLCFLMYAPFAALHPAMKRRVMQHFLPAEQDYALLVDAASIKPGDTVNLKSRETLHATDKYIFRIPANPVDFTIPPLRTVDGRGGPGDGIRCQRLPKLLYEKCSLRRRLPGDVIQPFGMSGSKTLSDYLTDRKIEKPFRDYLPILAVDNRVIWVIGVGPGEEARCTMGKPSVFLEYSDKLPYDLDF